MKKNVCFLLATSAMLLGSCKNNSSMDDAAEVNKISRQCDSLIDLSIKKDSLINTFVSSFAEIENNLVTIRQKEEILSLHAKKNVELKGNKIDEVNENIKMINDLMDKNRKQISSLNAKLKDANFTIKQLASLVDILITNINYKNRDLISLDKALIANGKLVMRLNTAMIDFGVQSADKTDTINEKNKLLNTAYYIIGQTGELKEKKILNEKGGFLSPNQYEKINPDFNTDDFKKIDIKQTTTIPITGKDIKLLTTHPSSSYKLENKEHNAHTSLVIIDPDKFWSESKYLVISVD